MVISRPSSSCTIVMQSLRYCIVLSRTAASAWIRSRPANISDTDPQQRTPFSWSKRRTSFVSYLSGSPAIPIVSSPYFGNRRLLTSIGSARIQLCIERNILVLLLLCLWLLFTFYVFRNQFDQVGDPQAVRVGREVGGAVWVLRHQERGAGRPRLG